MKELNIRLRKKGADRLSRTLHGTWILDGKEITQEEAITELVEAVQDLGYWCQVAKDVLPTEEYAEVQRCVEYQE
jgi:hypothetical protein